jgi:hypothetical protein
LAALPTPLQSDLKWSKRDPSACRDASRPSRTTEETNPQNYLKLVASGDVDETMLDALEDYVKRQKKRLGLSGPKEPKFRVT